MEASGYKPTGGGRGSSSSKREDEMSSVVDMALLRSHRSSQMTESYQDDPEVSKILLAEKEKDLELAARIGKALLQRNDDLQRKNEILEEQMGRASDQVTQLKHELHRKSELLRVFTEDSGDSSGDLKRSADRGTCGTLKKRVRKLEEENAVLKVDITQLKAMTIVLKEKEDQIVAEFLRKLGESKRQSRVLSVELREKQNECDVKENKIRCLNKDINEKVRNEQTLKDDNGMMASKLRLVQGLQEGLAQELQDLQDRYAEVLSMLAGARQELKDALERQAASRFSTSSMADDATYYDSLASELEASDSGYSFCGSNTNTKPRYSTSAVCGGDADHIDDADGKRTETARCPPPELLEPPPPTILPVAQPTLELTEQYVSEDHEELDQEDTAGFRPVESDSEASERAKWIIRSIEEALAMPLSGKGATCRYSTRLGVPGTPGSKDLEFAIERLKQKSEDESPKTPTPDSSRPAAGVLRRQNVADLDYDPSQVRMRRSTDQQSTKSTTTVASNRAKLMLVVPVEGSRALEHWKQLATPSGIDPRSWANVPGINVKSSFGGVSNSPQIPVLTRKQLTVSSIFVNANLPLPASARPKSEIVVEPSLVDAAGFLSAVPAAAPKSVDRSLTEKYVGFLNSIGNNWLPRQSSKVDNQQQSGNTSVVNGLLGSLYEQEHQTRPTSGVVLRSGMKMKK